jgi:hypothetical protein
VTAFVLAGGPTIASADQCASNEGARAVTQPLAAECATDAQAAGAAMAGRPGARIAAATPNEASPPPEENTGDAVEPAASTGPEVPETTAPGEESGSQPVVPGRSGGPEVPETQPAVPAESPSPSEGTGTQPAVPAESPAPSEGVGTQPAVPENGANQPELPVTGTGDGKKLAGGGAALLAAGTAMVVATRRRRTS